MFIKPWDIEDITPNELLFIDRRRRGETQEQAARRLGTTRKVMSLIESGKRPVGDIEKPTVHDINNVELCTIARRRSGLTQKKLAGLMRVSRWWLNQMERELVCSKALIEFWEKCNNECETE